MPKRSSGVRLGADLDAVKKELADYVAEIKQARAHAPGEVLWETCVALQKERDQLVEGVRWMAEKFGRAGAFDDQQKRLIQYQLGIMFDETRQSEHGANVRRRIKRLRTRGEPALSR